MKPLLRVQDAAVLLGLKEITVRKKITQGLIPFCRFGKKAIRIKTEDVEAMIKNGYHPTTQV